MGNISKKKREIIINFMKVLRKEHSDEDSIRAFAEIENFLLDKKFGLLWEEHYEEVDELLKDNIPVFTEDPTREVCSDTSLPWNYIIEGDNLQALYLLSKTHQRNVDCIYIDPPYNTGAKDWKYNNDYVDSNDTFRHSKWLSMMNVRLRLAKELLRDDGVLICAIDENELATLSLLLEEIFGLNYSIDTVCIVHNPRGVQGDNFSYTNEYALFVYKKGSNPITNREIDEDEVDWRDLRDNGGESLREDAATCFYAINVKDGKIVGFGENKTQDESFHPHRNEMNEDGSISIYPIDVGGVEHKWRYNRESVEKIVDRLRVKTTKGVYDIELGKNYGTYRTVWTDKKYDSNEYGTKLINDIVPTNDFDFPKSLYNVYECLFAVVKDRPNAVILDFFAGSGTTGHATLLMNSLLGGQRRFILCTNNDIGYKKEKEFKKEFPQCVSGKRINTQSPEYQDYAEKYGIARSITYPRVRNVINGYTSTSGTKTIVYEEKLTPKKIFTQKKLGKIHNDINSILTSLASDYEGFDVKIENDCIRVYASVKKDHFVSGLQGNLHYVKCGWTPRQPEDSLLSNALTMHIREMIELQNGIKLDNERYVLVINKADYKKYVADNPNVKKIKKMWVNQNIIFNSGEMKRLKLVGYKYIPKEFFGQELREAAE